MKEERRNKMICFHDPDKEYGFLSNWYMSDYIEDGRLYTSVEQYLMYGKAVVFKDEEMQRAILDTHDVAKIKQYGRQVKGYNETVWNGLRQLVLYRGLWLKFSQNDELKQKLIDTGNDMLVECARTDKIFACGISMKDPLRFDMSKWLGKKSARLCTDGFARTIEEIVISKLNPRRRRNAALLLLYRKNSGLVKSVVVCVCVAKGGAMHMTTLEDLYYGNISPHERYIKRGTRVDKLVKLICKNEDELTAGLTEKQKETFEKFKDCTSELSCITEREAFSSGFILATRIMAEVMQGLEEIEDI